MAGVFCKCSKNIWTIYWCFSSFFSFFLNTLAGSPTYFPEISNNMRLWQMNQERVLSCPRSACYHLFKDFRRIKLPLIIMLNLPMLNSRIHALNKHKINDCEKHVCISFFGIFLTSKKMEIWAFLPMMAKYC